MKRFIGLVRWVLVLVLAVLVLHYAPQSSPEEHAPPVPSDNVELMARTHIPKVQCFRKSVERTVLFGHWLYDDTFRSLPAVSYWYCHNWYGRDWVRPYHIRNTVLYQRNLCKFEKDEEGIKLRGFRVRFYFRDGYRGSKNYSRGFWQDCHAKGFSSRSKYLPRRSTPRLFNVKNLPPWAIVRIIPNYSIVSDGHGGKKRLPMQWHTPKPGYQI